MPSLLSSMLDDKKKEPDVAEVPAPAYIPASVVDGPASAVVRSRALALLQSLVPMDILNIMERWSPRECKYGRVRGVRVRSTIMPSDTESLLAAETICTKIRNSLAFFGRSTSKRENVAVAARRMNETSKPGAKEARLILEPGSPYTFYLVMHRTNRRFQNSYTECPAVEKLTGIHYSLNRRCLYATRGYYRSLSNVLCFRTDLDLNVTWVGGVTEKCMMMDKADALASSLWHIAHDAYEPESSHGISASNLVEFVTRDLAHHRFRASHTRSWFTF